MAFFIPKFLYSLYPYTDIIALQVTANTVLTFQLVVNDGLLNSSPDTVNVTVLNVNVNQPPIANAGPDQTVNEGFLVTLNGSGSGDPDGNPLTFSWTQTAGPAVTLSNSNSATPTFTAPQVGANTVLIFPLLLLAADVTAFSSSWQSDPSRRLARQIGPLLVLGAFYFLRNVLVGITSVYPLVVTDFIRHLLLTLKAVPLYLGLLLFPWNIHFPHPLRLSSWRIARFYLEKRDFAEAEKYFAEAARRFPYSSELRNDLVQVYYIQGKFDESRSELEAALRISPYSSILRENFQRLLGRNRSGK